MKKILLTLAALMLLPLQGAHSMTKADDAAMMSKPLVKVVAYHADWCGACKILGPNMKQAMDSLPAEAKEKLKVVRFDFTSDETKMASKEMAMKHNLMDHFPKGEGKPKTGVVKILDAETHAVIGKIKSNFSAREIEGVLKAVTMR